MSHSFEIRRAQKFKHKPALNTVCAEEEKPESMRDDSEDALIIRHVLLCSCSVIPAAAASGAASVAQLCLATTTIKTAAHPLIQRRQPSSPQRHPSFHAAEGLIMQASYVTLLAPCCPISASVCGHKQADGYIHTLFITSFKQLFKSVAHTSKVLKCTKLILCVNVTVTI